MIVGASVVQSASQTIRNLIENMPNIAFNSTFGFEFTLNLTPSTAKFVN